MLPSGNAVHSITGSASKTPPLPVSIAILQALVMKLSQYPKNVYCALVSVSSIDHRKPKRIDDTIVQWTA
jgi:hypothetical protein